MKTTSAIALPAPLAGAKERVEDAQPAALVILEWLMVVGVWAIPMRAPIADVVGSRVSWLGEGRSLTQYVTYLAVPLLPLIARRVTEAARTVTFAAFLLAFAYGTMVVLTNGHTEVGIGSPLRIAMEQFWVVYVGILSCVLARRPESRERLVNAYLLGWACLSVVSVAAYLSGRFHYELGEYARPGDVVRISLFHENTNGQSITLATGMPVAVTRLIETRSSVRASALVAVLAMSAYALLLGSSRTGILILLVGMLFVATWNVAKKEQRKLTKRDGASLVKTLSVVAIGGFLVWFALREDLLARSVTSLEDRFQALADASDDGDRLFVAKLALKTAFETPLGVGLSMSESVLRISPHNEYARIYLECGVPGLVLMILGLGSLAATVVRIYRAGGDSAVPGALFVILVASGVSQDLYFPPAWFLIGVTVASGEAARLRSLRGGSSRHGHQPKPASRKGRGYSASPAGAATVRSELTTRKLNDSV
jgi:O-antigen ligase